MTAFILLQTCKRLSGLTKLRIIWYQRISFEVLAKNIPIPGPLLPVTDIPANDLEWRTRRALKLDNYWRAPSKHSLPPRIDFPSPSPEDVRHIMLLYGTDDILTVLSNKLCLWHVDDTPQCSPRTARLTEEWISPSSEFRVARDTIDPCRVAVQLVTAVSPLFGGC